MKEKRFGKVHFWTRPGGMSGGRLKALAGLYRQYCLYLPCALNTAEPGKGLAVFNRSAHSAGPGIFETRVQAETEATVNKVPQEQWQNQDRRYEICFKMDAKAEVMSNRASKVSHFPPSRQNILLFAQHKAEMLLEK